MQEQLEAKAWEANSLTDKKEFVAAAVLATQPVALAENCRSGASQRKILIEFHEFVEQIAQDGRKWLAGSLAQVTTRCVPCSQAQATQVMLLFFC